MVPEHFAAGGRSALLLALLGLSFWLGACEQSRLRYEEQEVRPHTSLICPGDPSGLCDFSEEQGLRVGAAAVSITPMAWETWIDEDGDGLYRSGVDRFLDCGGDRLCPDDDGYPGPDAGEGNGQFEALWLAGFSVSRPMQSVADDIWARATVLEQGETRIGVVSLDLVGFFYDEVLSARETAAREAGLDHGIIASTHVHEAPDTMGIWGPNLARSGQNADYMSQVHLAIQDALAQANRDKVEAEAYQGFWTIDDSAWSGSGINNINVDSRAPHITDPTVWTLRFAALGSGETLATWINFANHPEAAASRNVAMSSDFAHSLRLTVEEGASQGPQGPLAGLGGVAQYLQGACGGMMTPLGASTVDLDGTVYSTGSIEKAYAVGRVTGYHALQAVAGEQHIAVPSLSLRTRQLLLPVENQAYHLMLNLGIIDREGYNYDSDSLIDRDNIPDLITEISLLELGSASALTLPGELLPELLIGGYDGAHTGPLQELVNPDSSSIPNLDEAPDGPYLRDLMPGEGRMLLGLANDELGYFIPDYNYRLHEQRPYLDEAPGDHYEETNSLGPSATGLLLTATHELLAFEPPEL
ncbi:MAG: hypothetical protein CMP23_13990 [Rickettsiales bacterium]|nr:hypothetical protein [Rickettsiales bacterium]